MSSPLAVSAGAGSVSGTVPGAIKMLNLDADQSLCQGVTVTAVVNLTGQQDGPAA